MTEAELAELERVLSEGPGEDDVFGDEWYEAIANAAPALLSLARRAAKLEGALREAKDWIDPRTSPVPLTSMQMVARIDAALTPEQP